MRAHDSVLVFDPGDEFVATLQQYIAGTQIPSAWFQAIGAFETSVIAYWNRETKRYEDIAVNEQVEVLALSGNVNRTKLHAHVVLGKRDGSTIGGHLKSGVVYPTLELWLTPFTHELLRQRDEETGLDLIR